MTQLELELMTLGKACAKKYLAEKDTIDWEQRRYEIAKTMLPALHRSFAGSYDWQCKTAVMYADKLIHELQQPKEEPCHTSL